MTKKGYSRNVRTSQLAKREKCKFHEKDKLEISYGEVQILKLTD